MAAAQKGGEEEGEGRKGLSRHNLRRLKAPIRVMGIREGKDHATFGQAIAGPSRSSPSDGSVAVLTSMEVGANPRSVLAFPVAAKPVPT